MKMKRGFTLLEVMIAMAILAFITLFTAQSIQKALQNKGKIQGDIDRYSNVSDALKVMENDINRAFNYRDINIALYNAAATTRNKKIEEATNKQGGNPADPQKKGQDPSADNPASPQETMKLKKEKILTHFLGESNRLDFTSLSNARISSEERTSDQVEIGYSLKDCRHWKNRKETSKCLFRRVSTLIDDDITQGGEETPLLENVTKLEFQYLGPAETTWTKTWYTNERGDDRTKGVFPVGVEITIEIKDPTNTKLKPLSMTLVAAIRNPNNLDKNNPDTALPDGTNPLPSPFSGSKTTTGPSTQ